MLWYVIQRQIVHVPIRAQGMENVVNVYYIIEKTVKFRDAFFQKKGKRHIIGQLRIFIKIIKRTDYKIIVPSKVRQTKTV